MRAQLVDGGGRHSAAEREAENRVWHARRQLLQRGEGGHGIELELIPIDAAAALAVARIIEHE